MQRRGQIFTLGVSLAQSIETEKASRALVLRPDPPQRFDRKGVQIFPQRDTLSPRVQHDATSKPLAGEFLEEFKPAHN